MGLPHDIRKSLRPFPLVAGVLVALGLGALTVPKDASAQATDLKAKLPNALLLIDTSNSMKQALDGTNDIDCSVEGGAVNDGDNDVKKPRWTVLAETLTGSMNSLSCWNDPNANGQGAGSEPNWMAYETHECRVYGNIESYVTTALAADPYSWPQKGRLDYDDDAIIFCDEKAGDHCNCTDTCGPPGQDFNNRQECGIGSGNGKWDQKADGMLDIYGKSIRFGVASFDTLQNLPNSHYDPADTGVNTNYTIPFSVDGWPFDAEAATSPPWGPVGFTLFPYGQPVGCQRATTGARCKLESNDPFGFGDLWKSGNDAFSDPQYSYWFKSAAEKWINNTHPSYGGTIRANGPTLPKTNWNEDRFDIGIQNSRATPQRGRLIGFGPKDWDFDTSKELNSEYCSNEGECTELHNWMVQQSILGSWNALQNGTPLSAMLRDTYEFLKNDDETVGVHIPHDEALTPLPAELKGTIGVQTDSYFLDTPKCRETSVILVTDGEPAEDLQSDRMSDWSDAMWTDATLKVKTYVIGIGLSEATWTSDQSTLTTTQCDALTSADLGAGKMCHRNASNQWERADDTTLNGDDAGLAGVTKPAIRACCELLETAFSGGTGTAFYPKTAIELKQRFSAIFNNLAGGASSRTVPVFAPTTANFASNAPATAPAIFYELRSSMDVTADNSLWRGNLERVRYTCNGFDPEKEAVTVASGDAFQENLDATTVRKRKFFTVNTVDADALDGTIRTVQGNPNAADNLFKPGGSGNKGDFERLGGGSSDFPPFPPAAALPPSDKLVEAKDLATELNLVGSDNAEDLLEISGGDIPDCQGLLDTNNVATCADRVFRWFGGDPKPDGGTGVAPSRSPSPGSQCKDLVCSPMGAIYRTVPAIIPPPAESDSDDQSYGRTRVAATAPSFVAQYGTRPTMIYTQTIDGMLHGFVLSRNEYTSGPFNQAPDAGTLQNNELWSFIPPMILPNLFDNFNQHSRQLDGQLAWANVNYERSRDVDDVDWEYNTVLVGSSGVTTHGKGFYYALDVTDPFNPRFLWQMRSSGDNQGKPKDPLFGAYTPGAAITNIIYKDRAIAGAPERNIAVAILPGGTPAGPKPSGTRNRRGPDTWDAANHEPRRKIRDWGNNEPARSLTFVELKTGRILARLTGEPNDGDDNPNDPDLDSNVVVSNSHAQFDSPISGIPVAYPAGIGKVSDRVYVGDIDGTLWRVDIHDPDPKAWTADIAFDYNFGTTAGSSTMHDAWVGGGNDRDAILADATVDVDVQATMGQPIQNAPLLSQDIDGNLVVTYSTGDQEAFQQETTDQVNLLVSFADVLDLTPVAPAPSGGGFPVTSTMVRYEAKINATTGVELAFKDGAAVTGPVNLFDSQLYFAYFVPSNASACTVGKGGLCGMHFQERAGGYKPKRAGVDTNTDGTVDDDDICADFTGGEVVFGVSINLVPACTPAEQTFNDPWLGGKYNARTNSRQGKYELVYHTGQGGTGDGLSTTKRSQLDVPTPKSRTRVRTWVSVVE